MVEFSLSLAAFKKAIRTVMVGRSEYMDHDTADLVAVADTVELCSTGTSIVLPATVVQGGCGRIPLVVLRNAKRAAASFKKNRLRVRIEGGRIKLDSFSFSHPEIELKPIGTRIADLPINATALDCLAVQTLFSAEEIAESGLAPRILDAQEIAVWSIKSAADTLAKFGVPLEAVRDLVEAHIALHARATVAALAQT